MNFAEKINNLHQHSDPGNSTLHVSLFLLSPLTVRKSTMIYILLEIPSKKISPKKTSKNFFKCKNDAPIPYKFNVRIFRSKPL